MKSAKLRKISQAKARKILNFSRKKNSFMEFIETIFSRGVSS